MNALMFITGGTIKARPPKYFDTVTADVVVEENINPIELVVENTTPMIDLTVDDYTAINTIIENPINIEVVLTLLDDITIEIACTK